MLRPPLSENRSNSKMCHVWKRKANKCIISCIYVFDADDEVRIVQKGC
jgi:hypothetical protein